VGVACSLVGTTREFFFHFQMQNFLSTWKTKADEKKGTDAASKRQASPTALEGERSPKQLLSSIAKRLSFSTPRLRRTLVDGQDSSEEEIDVSPVIPRNRSPELTPVRLVRERFKHPAPSFIFPGCVSGIQTRRVTLTFLQRTSNSSLEYDQTADVVRCWPCFEADQRKLVVFDDDKRAFIDGTKCNKWKGLSNGAGTKLSKHYSSNQHKDSMRMIILKDTNPEIKGLLGTDLKRARHVLKLITKSILFLGVQGLADRGHEDDKGNFMVLIRTFATEVEDLNWWINRGVTQNYFSHQVKLLI
jgi:hypothetical protein